MPDEIASRAEAGPQPAKADNGATAASFAGATAVIAEHVERAAGITLTPASDLLGEIPALKGPYPSEAT